jgi:RNA-directed DNA polymerase
MEPQATIWTEGKTDWRHLKRAFSVLRPGAQITFKELESDFGHDKLLKQCEAFALETQPRPTIFVFDRDNDDIVKKVTGSENIYKSWGNNVFSFAIPVPSHRNGDTIVCIESYYFDEQLQTPDENGRRLFFTSEFNADSGRHSSDGRLSIGNKGKLSTDRRATGIRIVDSEVFNEQSQNVALSKAAFAAQVAGAEREFTAFHFESFRPILSVVESIILDTIRKTDVAFVGLREFLNEIEGLENEAQFVEIVRAAIRVSKLNVMLFIAATLRHYEKRIVDAKSSEARRVRPIKQILAQSFGHPSLTTLQRLARHCYHLIDGDAPVEVHTLRAMLAANPLLGAVGDLLDDLERIFGAPKVRIVNKSQSKRPLLEYVIPELARYEAKLPNLSELPTREYLATADSSKWTEALHQVMSYFEHVGSLSFRVKLIERKSNTNEFEVLVTTYAAGAVSLESITQNYNDIDTNRFETCELLVSGLPDNVGLDLFPFVVIKADTLSYYSRTKPKGFEYRTVFSSRDHTEENIPGSRRRKFAHVALRTTIATELQSLFWTQVSPSVSPLGVKANIPAQEEIVGRKKQIATIMEEIIQIPNQNGIIYGPGGVGKTALLVELTRQLWEEFLGDPLPFKNIIWASAKPNYYDTVWDDVRQDKPQFSSLDTVLTAILQFLDYEDAETYDIEDKKWLVLESLAEEKTLLILDNFESITDAGQKVIRDFFALTAKIYLKNKPDFFKVIITSRTLVPSGFHQINLKGLDEDESRQLMQRLYQPYARSGKAQRTEEEIHKIYDLTSGIPLIIKHCYGQVYEHNVDLNFVLNRLSQAGNKVVDFSFAEVFDLLKKDPLQLRIILLLELSARRLMTRQIAEILGADESEVSPRLSQLVSYQCASVVSSGSDEKYGINDQVHLFTRRLTLEYATIATEIRQQIANLALDKRLDYTKAEYDALMTFEDYMSEGHYVLAENFMNDQLKENAGSLLLNLHYAKYLKEIKRRTEDAIERLEGILKPSNYDQQVLRLLMAYYAALEIPNYEQAHSYARELEGVAESSNEIKMELAQFYVQWSTATKLRKELDPLKEKVRQRDYKEWAQTAILILKDVHSKTHEWHFLMAQSYFNRGENDAALKHIDNAIKHLPFDAYLYDRYRQLKHEVGKKRAEAEERALQQQENPRRMKAGRAG